jgi:hypothetical protein
VGAASIIGTNRNNRESYEYIAHTYSYIPTVYLWYSA